MRSSVRLVTLTLAALAITTGGATLTLGVLDAMDVRQEVETSAEARHTQMASALAQLLEERLRREVRSAENLASVIEVTAPTLAPSTLHPLLSQRDRRYQSTLLIVVGTQKGVGISWSDIDAAEARARARRVNYGDRGYLQTLRTTQETVVSHVTVGHASKHRSIIVAAPTRTSPPGFVAMAVDLDRFAASAQRLIGHTPEARAVVWDASGRLVIDTAESDRDGAPAIPETPLFAEPAGFSEIRHAADERGVMVMGAATRARVHEQTWTVVVSQPEAVVYAAVGAARARTLKTLLYVLAAASIVAVLLARAVARPVAQLARVAQLIEGGNLDFGFKMQRTLLEPAEATQLARGLERMMERLRAHARDLEGRVGERTAQLKEARQKAVDASRAKSEFLARMTHELRTPMNGIVGNLESVLQADLPAEVRDAIAAAQSSSCRLHTLLEDLIDVSALDAGHLELRPSPYTARSTLRFLLDGSFADCAASKQLRFELQTEGELDRVLLGDARRIHQVASNLIGNALKFTESGEVSVTLAVQAPPSGEGAWRLRIDVRDTGPGVPVDKQHRIFELDQLEDAMRRRHGGTGLGLALSRRLARRMAGDVTVQSRPEGGACFRFVAELAPADAQEHLPDLEHPVLAVDDNPVNLKVVSRLLTQLGVRVETATDGAEAVELALSKDYALIFMDLQMPVMDGCEAARRIRDARPVPLPIVALTANTAEEDRREAREAGMVDHLGKPVRKPLLAAALALHARRAR